MKELLPLFEPIVYELLLAQFQLSICFNREFEMFYIQSSSYRFVLTEISKCLITKQ